MKLLQKISCLLIAVGLQACVTGPKYTPLTQETKANIGTASTYNLIVQDEIKPDVDLINTTAALGGGLIGAMIDSSVNDDRATEARSGLQPLYDEIVDLDHRKTIADKFNQALASSLPLSDIKDTAESIILGDKELVAKIKKLAKGEAMVLTNTFYQFRMQSKMLQTISTAFIFLNSENPKISKPHYFNTFYYQSPLIGSGGQNSINEWAADGADLFRSELEKSAQQTADWMQYDMQTIRDEKCIAGGVITVPMNQGSLKVKGNVIKDENENKVLRGNNGHLYIVASESVTKAKVKTCQVGE
ncbi:hypothetical protein [Glaciecola petra]|uniref:Lipoprotein n=1 Tax=Glaciecola petra TaxID=3075602 RepID=A0ABU2ZTY8_9ALTE|nr:hypothetical protein [Aestuariibacter sp. P117]MDT0596114.1 hypothetical protein [Aestuariibacter sp. P117]